jgi:hypothetical protein
MIFLSVTLNHKSHPNYLYDRNHSLDALYFLLVSLLKFKLFSLKLISKLISIFLPRLTLPYLIIV